MLLKVLMNLTAYDTVLHAAAYRSITPPLTPSPPVCPGHAAAKSVEPRLSYTRLKERQLPITVLCRPVHQYPPYATGQ